MKIHRRKSLAVSLVLAMGLATFFVEGTAHAAKPTPKIAGEHYAFMTGFNGETPSTVLYHLKILRNNGNAFIGTQRL